MHFYNPKTNIVLVSEHVETLNLWKLNPNSLALYQHIGGKHKLTEAIPIDWNCAHRHQVQRRGE